MKVLLVFFLPIVRAVIQGINMYGFETEHSSLSCDWVSTYDQMLGNVKMLGFNTIRLPFSHDYIHKTDMKSMDYFFEAVLKTNLQVVLDFHRIYNSHQSAKPNSEGHTIDCFINDWITILDRYKGNSHLVGVDVFNEWQDGNAGEWNDIATKTLTEIENKFPYRFFYMVGCTNWGSDCSNVVINLPYQDRIFYTIHRYVWHGDYSNNWDHVFNVNNGQKMIVGEYGAKSDLPNQMSWFKQFLEYLKSKNITNSFFWTYGISGDTGGIYKDDCLSVEWDKINLLWNYWGYKPKRYLRSHNCTHVGWNGCVG